jgi:hypothetical protein
MDLVSEYWKSFFCLFDRQLSSPILENHSVNFKQKSKWCLYKEYIFVFTDHISWFYKVDYVVFQTWGVVNPWLKITQYPYIHI